MQRICRKCGHVNKEATGTATEPCPSCGAIYSRVEAAQKGEQIIAAERARPRAFRSGGASDYLSTLRDESNYPTFRGVVQLFTIVGYFLTGIAALGTLMPLFRARSGISVTAFLVGLGLTAFFFIMTRVFKEISLMVADGCDALVRMAERQETGK